jgi:anti-sigma-D factor RsdA-like protein
MPESGRSPFDQSDPADLARTERFIDALATRQSVEFDDDRDQGDHADPGDRALAALLEDWRDELRSPPARPLFSELEAVAALNRGLAARRRIRGGLALIGSVAATMLGIGGFAAMVGDAQPGDALYGVHTMLFGEQPWVHDDRIALSAKTDLHVVQQMITLGEWDEAQVKLAAVNDSVQTVNDSYRKQDLIDQVNLLNAKVAHRDPNATVSPSSLSNPEEAPVTGTTAEATASATTSDASATAISPSQSTTDPSASLSATSPVDSSAAPGVGVSATPTVATSPVDSSAAPGVGVSATPTVATSPVDSSAAPGVGVSATSTAPPSGNSGTTSQQANRGAG